MSTAEDEWMSWLTEATTIVSAWERARSGLMLQTADAAVLTERVARNLMKAFERGRAAG